MKKHFYLSLTILAITFSILNVNAQVNVSLVVDSGTSGTSCTDGTFGGTPEIHWRVNIANQGYTTYPQSGICFQNTPYTQYNETYNCASSLPSNLQVCFSAFEDDGANCILSQSCLEQICQNYALPSIGSSISYTLSIPNNGSNSSWGSVNFTISVSGNFPPGGQYDEICSAINLGTLNTSGSLGNIALSNYGNFCATNTGEPSPWGGTNDQGTWFQFTTGNTPSTSINFSAETDPQSFGDGIDLQLALYESSNGTCSGALTLIQENYEGIGVIWTEEMDVSCLTPNTTYFLLIDGEESSPTNGGGEGFFGLQINDNGIQQAADEICDAENLGLIPDGGSVGTPALSRSNSCATNVSDPTPLSWASDQTVWFMFQAPLSGHAYIDINADLPFPIGINAIDLQVAVYSSSDGTCTGTINHIASQYNSGLFDEDIDIRCLTPGENYWVMIDGSATNVDGIFDITVHDGGQAPATNNAICDAKSLGSPTVGSPVSLLNENNYCADNLFESSPSTWQNDQGVWYSFIAPSSGMVSIVANDHGTLSLDQIDLQLAVCEVAGGLCHETKTELASEHNDAGTIWDEEVVVSCLVPGTKYWILVDGEGSLIDPDLQEGIFDITVTAIDTIATANTGIDTQAACDSLLWINGITYFSDNNSATHQLTNVAGCDSIVTLDLTINTTTNGTDTRIACDSLVWIDGITYFSDNTTATFNIVGGAATTCDSLVTLNLTINSIANGTDTRTACDSLVWIDGTTYFSDNTTATFNIVGGAATTCDSLVTLDLTINTVDTSLLVTGNLMTANAIGADYQWLDCENSYAILPGENNQNYTIVNNGNYAVEVTQNGCIDTSSCYQVIAIGVVENSFDSKLIVFPNPTSGKLSINLGRDYNGVSLTVTNITGQTLIHQNIEKTKFLNFEITGPKGVYFIDIKTVDGESATLKVVKK